MTTTLSHGLSWIDLEFLGRSSAIAAGIVQSPAGVAVIDPGPTSCLDVLETGLQSQGVRWDEVRHILLTHIHLDHAGATGTILRAHPHITVAVHARGAPHMVDPAKLLDSATRLYGDQMDRLWGEVAPVPRERLVTLSGGERIEAGGRVFDVAYTPGHASHHVSYFDASSGVAFVGDTAGVCLDEGYVLPPTPPPDIDLELWTASVDRILAWSPSTLFLTHFGPVTKVRPHLAELLDHMQLTAAAVKASFSEEGTDEERSARFAEWLRRELRGHMSESQVDSYVIAAGFRYLWFGLARYWRKRNPGL
ncbi:MAG TPA: MBL fold metallo-hydrolase [Vicinamibacterales bacterium]|nr:MBL fold metallo-hydrolase [Vicinamibacterales bacterium]